MVDITGAMPITDSGATRVAAATPVAAPAATTAAVPVATNGNPSPAATVQTAGLARSMAASPPVDTDRVATIKKAIAEGRFPILPATVADRLIALKLQWSPNGAQHDEG